jgi:hypothetical protein
MTERSDIHKYSIYNLQFSILRLRRIRVSYRGHLFPAAAEW